MSDSTIATAYVSIRPNLDGFRDELRAGLDSEVDSLGARTVRIDADTTEASAKIDATGARLDDLGARVVDPTITADDDLARLKLDEVSARIDELQSKIAVARLDVDDTGARRKLADMSTALTELRNETINPRVDTSRLDAMGSDLDDIDGRLQNFNQDLSTTEQRSNSASQAISGGGAGGGGLLGAALALAPALVTVGAVGSAGLLGISEAAGMATLGLGAFALAAEGSLATVKTQASAMLTTWQATTQAFTDPTLERAVNLLPSVFQFLTPTVAATAQALQGMEARVQGALGSPFWHQFSSVLAGETEGALTGLMNLFGGFGHLLAGVADGTGPLLQRMDADLSRWGADLTKWGDEAANGGMTQFMDYVRQNGPLVAHTIEQFADDFLTLAKAASPVGPVMLNILDVAANLLGDLEKLDPTLTTLAVGFGSVAFEANKLLSGVGGLGAITTGAKGAISLLTDAATVGAGSLGGLALASGGVVGTLSEIAVSAGPEATLALAAIGGTVLAATGGLTKFSDAAAAGAKAFAQDFVQSLTGSGNSVSAVNAEIGTLNQQMATTQSAIDSVSASIGNMPMSVWNEQVGKLSGQWGALGQTLLDAGVKPTETVSGAYDRLTNGPLNEYEDKIAALQKLLPGLQTAQDAQTQATNQSNTALGLAAGYTGDTALQFGQLTTALSTANQALSTTVSQLNNLLGAELSAEQANLGFYTAVTNLTGALHTNGTTLDITTTKGQANRQAFDAVAQSIDQEIQSLEKQGASSETVSSKVQSMTNYLIDQAGKYGLTTQQVEAYLHQLGLTPAQVKTALELSGYDQAQAKVSSLTGQLNAINGRTFTSIVSVQEQITQAIQGGGERRVQPGSATGTVSHWGGEAWVAEHGPEVAISPSGKVTTYREPQVANIERGTRILTAQETARLPGYAEGAQFEMLPPVSYGGARVVTINDQRTVIVGDLASKQDILAALDADRAEMERTLGQLVGA